MGGGILYTRHCEERKRRGNLICCRIKKLKFLFTTFCQQKVVPKLRGDKFSGSQLAVGKMVAFALLRVKRSPFLNPPSALRPSSENSSAAFLLSPTEYIYNRHCEERKRRGKTYVYIFPTKKGLPRRTTPILLMKLISCSIFCIVYDKFPRCFYISD